MSTFKVIKKTQKGAYLVDNVVYVDILELTFF